MTSRDGAHATAFRAAARASAFGGALALAASACRERSRDVVGPDPKARAIPSVVAPAPAPSPSREAQGGIVVRIAVAPAGSVRVGLADEPLDTIASTTDPKAFAEVADHVAARRRRERDAVVTIDGDSAVPIASVRALIQALESVGVRKLAFSIHREATPPR